jgi:hypothetical protein
VWENEKNHKVSILDKIQEVKTVLEKLKVKTENQKQKTEMPVKEGVLMGEIVQITV